MAKQWPIEERDLANLDLDLRNVRIPAEDLDQSAIANYLVEAEDLLELIRGILRDGYLDNELPVVVAEDERCVVLEGNRRITALKAIHRPELVGKSAPRIERLLSRYPDAETPTTVRVMFAPSREAAQPLLARLHTGKPKKSWLREQQAVFYHAQLSPTVTVNDLRRLYPAEAPSVIASFIRMGEMRELIRKMRYDDPSLEDFVKNSQLKMTSFEYAYELPKIQAALGISFDKDGLLTSKRLSEGQHRGLTYLLNRFRAKPPLTLNTRSPELKARNREHDLFAEQLLQLVAGVEGGAPGGEATDRGSGGSTGSSNRAGGNQPDSSGMAPGRPRGEAGPGAGPTGGGNPTGPGVGPPGGGNQPGSTGQPSLRGPNRGETRSRLSMEGFEYKGSSSGLRRRFEELKRLDVRDFPNGAYDLLRTVLECSIKDHFVSVRNKRLTGKQIGACIIELVAAYQQDQRMTSLINAVNRKGVMHAGQYAGTTASLNASNHEPDTFATAKDVHEAWDRIKPILIEIVGK
ncbi:hypothetical protein ACFP2T_19705 [Plantactinospora solaniradicis]|uniref:ParB/Sulfiredoxin domain-containing protein n=1 Tax=Plantactinospora solaniradicis TaxID=1723736 RepID=A0ABW1KCB3_9ACTN